MKICSNDAHADAKLAYEDIMYKIRNGLSVLDALNFAKQKYLEEHTINMASAFISKDILGADIKNNEVITLKRKISELDNNIVLQNKKITKREQTITSLKFIMQQQANEISLLKEKHKEDLRVVLNAMKEEALKQIAEYEKKLEEIQNSLSSIIVKKDEELSQQDKVIYKLNVINENLNLRIKDIEEKADKLIKENFILGQSNLNFKEQVEKLKKESVIAKTDNVELEERINQLIKQNSILWEGNYELLTKLNKNYTNIKKDDENIKKDYKKVEKNDIIINKEKLSYEELEKKLSDVKKSNLRKLEILQQIDIMKAIDGDRQILEDKNGGQQKWRQQKL